ncbi:MAG: GGDEF domain-containing protein, partial [Pseudomonas sp.]|uniref:diguanylate cyclase domain-containing protein n=1 Tax=Pseudomonas sp. TaxID=306 RepID=UPI0011F6333F
FIDLDGFKPINDKHGHPAGDLVLKEVAKRLEATVRGSDIVARLGGDEFVILQANVTEASEAELLARRIIKRLSAPIDIGEVSVSISGSVGIARSEDFGCDLDLLLSCADQALYRSKAAGKNRLNFSNESDFATARQAA